MKWRVVVELTGADGAVRTHEVSAGGATANDPSAATIGLTLADGKRTLAALQGHFVRAQAEEYCRGRRRCPRCESLRPLKDLRTRRLRSLFGTVEVRAPRFAPCRCAVTCRRTLSLYVRDYAHIEHGYAATVHKAQGVTVDRANVLATPHMDRHAAYVGLTRHRDGVTLHYAREDFPEPERLARTLSRERRRTPASTTTERTSWCGATPRAGNWHPKAAGAGGAGAGGDRAAAAPGRSGAGARA